MVLEQSYDESDTSAERPVAANIQVRPADGGNPLNRPQMQAMPAATESDEREVGNTKTHATAVNQRNTGHRPGTPVSANPGEQVQMGIEEQDGRVVPGRQFRTAAGDRAKNSRVVLTGNNVGAALTEANSTPPITPGQGITEGEMLERMAPADRDAYLQKTASIKAQYVDTEPAVVAKVVSKETGNKTRDGVTSSVTTSKGSMEVYDASGADPGKPKVETFEQDGMKFTTTNGPSRREQASPRSAEAHKPVMLKDGSADARRMIAKQMCPDFPSNYDFSQAPRKKLARLQADYEERPDVIRAVFAAESDDFKSTLMQEFPQAFSGK